MEVDLNVSPWQIGTLQLTFRLVLAVILGGLIGLEREQNNRAAGFRTHILVCLGAALLMLLSIYGFNDFVNEPNVRIDPARLAANVITGIGFLGAGTIAFNGASISGLTTAASLWVVAAIGMAVGAGFFYPSVIATLFVLFSLWMLNKVEKRIFRRQRVRTMRLEMKDRPGALASVTGMLAGRNIDIRKVSLEDMPHAKQEEGLISIRLLMRLPEGAERYAAVDELKRLDGVTAVHVE